MPTREQIYTAQLQDLGVYHPAFAPEIHTLAELEREHQRTAKAWKEAGKDPASDLYGVLERQRRDILTHRDALGLTPKGLRRLKSSGIVPEVNTAPDARSGSPAVALLMDTLRAQAAAAAAENAPVSDLDHTAGGSA